MSNNEVLPLLFDMAIFVAVAEEQSFSIAAHKLGMSPASVSRSVKRLEKNLQVKLLERTTRTVRLSNASNDVYKQCKEMLASAKGAVQAAQSTQVNAVGTLSIAAPKAFANKVLSPLVLDFVALHPGITLQFKVADHFIDPISEEVDVIFRLTNSPFEGLISKTLGTSDLVMCATPAYLKQHSTPAHPDDLCNHNCITLGESTGDNEWKLKQGNHQISIKTNSVFAVNHTLIRKAAALRDMGVTIFPLFSVKEELQSGQLVQVLPDWRVLGNYQGKVIMQYAQSRFIPIQIRVFVDYMISVFKQNPM